MGQDALLGVSPPSPAAHTATLCLRGRFGVIRLCKENATGKHFMAKIVPYEAERKQSVLQEYEILKALHHERIMALHEAYITPRYLVLICENCAGKEILYSIVDRYGWAWGCWQLLPVWGCPLMPLCPQVSLLGGRRGELRAAAPAGPRVPAWPPHCAP